MRTGPRALGIKREQRAEERVSSLSSFVLYKTKQQGDERPSRGRKPVPLNSCETAVGHALYRTFDFLLKHLSGSGDAKAEALVLAQTTTGSPRACRLDLTTEGDVWEARKRSALPLWQTPVLFLARSPLEAGSLNCIRNMTVADKVEQALQLLREAGCLALLQEWALAGARSMLLVSGGVAAAVFACSPPRRS
ncbi:hypothetical protein NDU88_005258 [Pleurodeles waltl]|uniref:Uncharacterized protein n=1 Tax=Pleurodeles waltl TaxID=8319 RepID=A0AAV7X053_PLEWA|nr:hypothetical protein NDU88_005258 [Pleurodeles waltl]